VRSLRPLLPRPRFETHREPHVGRTFAGASQVNAAFITVSGELSVAGRIATQHFENVRTLEDLADPCRRIDNPQRAIDRSRHVERPDQLADASGVESRDGGKIQHDSPFSAAKQRADAMTQRAAPGTAKRALDADDVGCCWTKLQNHGHDSIVTIDARAGRTVDAGGPHQRLARQTSDLPSRRSTMRRFDTEPVNGV
jgi:hypothetical protein